MREYVVCDMCTATITIDNVKCEFCDSDYKNIGLCVELLKFKDSIENNLSIYNIDEILDSIDKSKYKKHPIILFRKSKALLLKHILSNDELDAIEFIEVLKIIEYISKISEDYWGGFEIYLDVLLSVSNCIITCASFNQVSIYLKSIGKEFSNNITDLLVEKMVISEFGKKNFKEYKYYSKPENYIQDLNFIKKRDQLINNYDAIYNKILKNLNKK